MSWGRVGILYAGVAALMVVMSLGYAKERWGFGLNMTESLPHWAFVVDAEALATKGELAMFEVPDNAYYDRPFVKRIVGVEGDVIEVRGRRIYVAGVFVGEAKPFAQSGRPLEAIESQVIPAGYVFMSGEHIDSYDSRYAEIGLIPRERIIGRAFPVL
jgi:conjugal transfer pilin signal peptidase TrbI|tara:strand:- start:1464 stop:1937 length:474 start_codon:yes stop_codon:yes gene_type:complete